MLHGALNIAVQAIASAAQAVVAGGAARDLATRGGRAEVMLASMRAESEQAKGAANRNLLVGLVPLVVTFAIVGGLAFILAGGRR